MAIDPSIPRIENRPPPGIQYYYLGEEKAYSDHRTAYYKNRNPYKPKFINEFRSNTYQKTLSIDSVITELSPAGDLPKYNRYGVYLEIHVSGTGTGMMKIKWGTDHSETKTRIVAGNYAYVYNLPPGTHNVCAELFSVV